MNRLIFVLLMESFGNIFVLGCQRECCQQWISDCQDYRDLAHTTSGVYHVTPFGTYTGYDVYCDMTTDGGGWLVFQRRTNGDVNFNRNWDDYEKGFGNVTEEHWLGLLPLRRILAQGHYELRVDLWDWSEKQVFAKYRLFEISGFKQKYELTLSGFSGTAGDSLGSHTGQMFSTPESDNDSKTDINCAQVKKSGWWFIACLQSNLNGEYLGSHQPGTEGDGIVWKAWYGGDYSLKASEMKIRRV